MNEKLQVYVSTTDVDLIAERQVAIGAILDAGHRPAGMDFFGASDLELGIASKWINESDVYLLILGGYHDAIREEIGLSHIELEYRYAISKNMPVFAIVLNDSLLSTKITSTDFFRDNNINLYNNFKHFVISSTVFKYVGNFDDIRASIINILNIINLLKTSVSWTKSFYFNGLTDFFKIFKEKNTFCNTLIDRQNINKKFKYYFDIIEDFKIKNISNITENNCMVNPFGKPISNINNIRIDVSEVNDWMLNELNKNPTDLYKLPSRRFEEIIAEIFMRKGYSVELTPATRDGGKDIYIARKDDLGSFLYLVECKHYEPTHKVGVSVIRDLYGVLSKEKATYGIVVTTSDFTKPAQEFQQDIKFQMSLKNFNSIQKWICDVT